jgi:hypothetical protein
MLYGTTQKFLEHFGLKSLDDMPRAAELRAQAAALKTAEEKTAAEASASAEAHASATEKTDEGQAPTASQQD